MNNYQRSNAILTIDLDLSTRAKNLARLILASRSRERRQKLGNALLDELADLAKIDICKLKISDAKQRHKKQGGRVTFRQYGYYRPETKYIYINNRTAVRGQILAPKTFLNTLLHEWMHHFDSCKLGLDSIHTKGFYTRLHLLEKGLCYNTST
ncbi:hypothetical protein IH979_00675 [Patescibacteria group bacterium]|nr:hypothetical protein [Patescibacteria group bacterium]